jgi:hypothetical protein
MMMSKMMKQFSNKTSKPLKIKLNLKGNSGNLTSIYLQNMKLSILILILKIFVLNQI